MPDIVGVLSKQTGIAPELIVKGLSILLSFLKGKLDPTLFQILESALPGVPTDAPAPDPAAKGAPEAGSSLFGSIANLAGKLFGGGVGETAHVLSSLSDTGFSADQIQTFLPSAFEALKSHLPPELIEQLQGLLPTLIEPTGPAPQLDPEPETA
jgi:hypothetical protein